MGATFSLSQEPDYYMLPKVTFLDELCQSFDHVLQLSLQPYNTKSKLEFLALITKYHGKECRKQDSAIPLC